MVNHYFTLVKLIEELNPILIGTELVECFSQEKNSINFVFFDGNDEYVLQYTIFENKPVIFINPNFKRAKKNTIDLFPKMIGEHLQKIEILNNNRIVVFKFIAKSLIFHIFSPGNSNIILIDSNGIIIDAFKKGKELVGQKLNNPNPHLKSINDYRSDESIFKHLISSELLLNKYYCKELFHRKKLSEDLTFKDLPEQEITQILEEAKLMRQNCMSSKEFHIYNFEDSKLLSLIKLDYLNSDFEKFISINEAVFFRYKFSKINSTFLNKKKELISKFEKKYEKLKRKIENLVDEKSALERIQNYRKWAEILMAFPIHKTKKLDKIKLLDFDGNEIEIPLNIKKSIIENANDYFTKAKNNEKELAIRKKLIPKLQEEFKNVEKILSYIHKAKNLKDLDKIMEEFSDFDEFNESSSEVTKFRTFDLGDGFILYVGKNAANNDELTMKFAKPNDLWFHARGAGGSHAVLRLNKGQKPPKYIIKKAASIVAYYSQARKAKYVPVVYTYRKYVRKPKGANVGSVTISKEEVIMAEPSLPN